MDNTSDWQELVVQLQVLSQEMLQLARAGDWESVTEWEERRRSLLEDLFRQPLPPSLSPAIAACIWKVLTCDSEVLALGREAMDNLSSQLKMLAQGRKASLAYTEFEK